MSRRVTDADQVRALQRKHQTLSTQLSDLAAQHRVLIQRHAVLSCWCEAFSMLQLNLAAQEPATTSAHAEDSKFEILLQNEVQLLAQLVMSQRSHGQSEVMVFVLHAVAVKLHLVEAGPADQRPALLEDLKQAWFRYAHLLVSLALLGRQHISELAHHINLKTMQPGDPHESGDQQIARTEQFLPALGLSEQQQELICVGMHLYYDLVAPVHQERKDIDVLMTAAQAGSISSTMSDSGGTAGSGDSGGSSEQLESLHHRRQRLERQQQLTIRLTLLLHKEIKLRLITLCWFVGCLTYEQLSRAAVLSYPYGHRPLLTATEIMQQWDARDTLSRESPSPAAQKT